MVALTAWAAAVRSRGGTVADHPSIQTPYTYRTGLLRGLVRDLPWSDEVEATHDFYPLRRVAGAARVQAVASRVATCLHLDAPDARRGIVYAIGEIVRNAEEHALSELPAIFAAGWFRVQRRFTFSVADNGRGLLRSLRAKGVCRLEDDDAMAIEKALQPYVTGAGPRGVATAPNNAGTGLFQTRSFARDSGGRMMIVSGTGAYEEEYRSEAKFGLGSGWAGTVVGVTIRPDQVGALALRTGAVSDPTLGDRWVRSVPADARLLTPPVDDARFAANKTWYIERRPELVEVLSSGRAVHVDFGRAVYTTQSAIHALLAEPVREGGTAMLRCLTFTGGGQPLRAVVNLVLEYALAQHAAQARDGQF